MKDKMSEGMGILQLAVGYAIRRKRSSFLWTKTLFIRNL
jgi:hypothetical protein